MATGNILHIATMYRYVFYGIYNFLLVQFYCYYIVVQDTKYNIRRRHPHIERVVEKKINADAD